MELNYFDWEKKQTEWWKKQLAISDQGVARFSFIKRILLIRITYLPLLNSLGPIHNLSLLLQT